MAISYEGHNVTNLTDDDYIELHKLFIDLALDTGDKAWFDECVKMLLR